MVNITLPDGSVGNSSKPVSVAEVAASIGPGLAKAALGGKVDGKLVDTSHRIEGDAKLAIVTDKDARDWTLIPALDGAPARLRGEGALSEDPGNHRPG
jgi:threonyl-tRNA synthetase